MEKKLKAARQIARDTYAKFGVKSDEYETAMNTVRFIVGVIDADKPAEEFCSIDSGVHRTRMLNGRIV